VADNAVRLWVAGTTLVPENAFAKAHITDLKAHNALKVTLQFGFIQQAGSMKAQASSFSFPSSPHWTFRPSTIKYFSPVESRPFHVLLIFGLSPSFRGSMKPENHCNEGLYFLPAH